MLFFGLCNRPASFQYYISDKLCKYLDIFCIAYQNVFCMAYADYIWIYSNFVDKHKRQVKIVLECLRSASLSLNMIKYKFYIAEVPYL